MRGEQLSRALADERDADGVNEAVEAVLLAGGNFIEQILRGFFGHALETGERFEIEPVEIGKVLHQFLLDAAGSTILSPRPSIFMAWRPAKCRSDSLRRAGQETFTQR